LSFTEPPPVFVEVETCNLGMFVSGNGLGGAIISFTTEWVGNGEVETSNTSKNDNGIIVGGRGGLWRRMFTGRPATASIKSISSKEVSFFSDSAESGLPGTSPDFKVFSRIMAQLRTAYSHLRTGDAHTLFLKQLCDITEDYVNVMNAYDAALTVLGMRLDAQRDTLEQFEVQRLNACRQQITQMLRAVRPVAIVVDILDAREWGGDSELYLSDVKSNVIKFLDNASGIREKADLLADQFRNYCDAKTQRVIFILTLVTTLMTPLLFLTSLEGMNFMDMPEIHLQYGYLYFWLLCISIVVIVLLIYRRQRWI
jgi:hypothetical protein